MTRCQLLFLYPLTPFKHLATAKRAKYIIRPIYSPPCLFLPLPSSIAVPLSYSYSGLLAWALSRFEVALLTQPARDVVVCGWVRCGAALFRCTKCQGLTSVKAELCFSVEVICSDALAPIAADSDYKVHIEMHISTAVHTARHTVSVCCLTLS